MPDDVLSSIIQSMASGGAPALASQITQGDVPLAPVASNPQPMESLVAGIQPKSPPMVRGGVSKEEAEGIPTMAGRKPAIVNFIMGMMHPERGTIAGNRTATRADHFFDFMGNMLNSFSQGMAAAGHGPGANMRGAAAAIQAPYMRDVQEYQLRQQSALQQAQIEKERAQTEQIRSMGEMVQTPWGVMSKSLASKIWPAGISAQAKVESTRLAKRFMSVPNVGLVDTQATGGPRVVQGTNAKTVLVTPEIAEQYTIPQQLIGQQIPLNQFTQFERGGAAQWTIAQGAQGPALVRKGTGQAKDLGLGNPHQVANDIAAGRLKLSQQMFERDTFGTLFGKDIPSSLVDINGNTLGWKSPAMPVQSIKQQAQQAQDMLTLFKSVEKEIQSAKGAGKLGPLAGRLNEYMTGRVGADDPQFAKLRALGSLTASGMLKAHFGARGGQEMYKHFEDLFNTGRMTPDDLVGAMDGFKTFMTTYADRVRTAGDKSHPLVEDLINQYKQKKGN